MHNKTWKKERDLLSEAYEAVSETTHSPENSCKDDEYYCSKDKVCKKKADDADKHVKEEDAMDKELFVHADRPAGDEELPEPGETPEDLDAVMAHEPDEVDAEIDSLKNLILNPSKDKVEEYARNGQLHVYVDMLKKKLEAAEAVKAAVRGEDQ